MFEVLCGVLLLTIGAVVGFFAGKLSVRPVAKAETINEEQRQKELERQMRLADQLEKLSRYSGGAVNDDE